MDTFSMKTRWFGAVLLGLALTSTGCIEQASVAKATPPKERKIAPDFELTNIHGKKVRLSDFKGKPVLLNFWAYK